jgi:hypothetical protein
VHGGGNAILSPEVSDYLLELSLEPNAIDDAAAMPSRIDRDHLVSRRERRDIAALEPIFQALCEAMLRHQGWTGRN